MTSCDFADPLLSLYVAQSLLPNTDIVDLKHLCRCSQLISGLETDSGHEESGIPPAVEHRRDGKRAQTHDGTPECGLHGEDAEAHEPKVHEEHHVGRHDEEQDGEQQRPQQELPAFSYIHKVRPGNTA